MMRAPSVMRCRSMPMALMTTKTMAKTSGTDSATTMPVRQPSDRKLTTRTMISASAKERVNSPMACWTTAGWSATCSMSMPRGSEAVNSATAFFTSSPSASMLAPLAMTTPRPTAALPRWRTR